MNVVQPSGCCIIIRYYNHDNVVMYGVYLTKQDGYVFNLGFCVMEMQTRTPKHVDSVRNCNVLLIGRIKEHLYNVPVV